MKMNMLKLTNTKIPQKLFAYTKKNNPQNKYLVYEIWENGYPDKVVAGQKLEYNPETLEKKQLDRMIPFWKKLGKKLKEPIITIQVDEGNGSEIMYGYKDGKERVPPNAKSYTIKPVFDKNITKGRRAWKQGRSLVYSSPLGSPTLKKEVLNFNTLLVRFFSGKDVELARNNPIWEYRNEVVIDNSKLRQVN